MCLDLERHYCFRDKRCRCQMSCHGFKWLAKLFCRCFGVIFTNTQPSQQNTYFADAALFFWVLYFFIDNTPLKKWSLWLCWLYSLQYGYVEKNALMDRCCHLILHMLTRENELGESCFWVNTGWIVQWVQFIIILSLSWKWMCRWPHRGSGLSSWQNPNETNGTYSGM